MGMQGLLLCHLLPPDWNVASWSHFYRYYFGICSSELHQMLSPPYFLGSSVRHPDRLHDFLVTIATYYKDVCANSFLPPPVILWKSLQKWSIEFFSLTCDLDGFKSRLSRHLLFVGSSWTDFMYALMVL